MKRILQFIFILAIGIAAYILLGSRDTPDRSIVAEGFLFGRPFKTIVDDSLAQLMIADPQHKVVLDFFKKYETRLLTTETLSEISKEHTADVATLFYVQRNYQQPQNKQAQDLYLSNLDMLAVSDSKDQLRTLLDYYVVFVPGLNYHHAANGGNFARQRHLFSNAGIANELVNTDAWGMTDDNARIVAERLRTLSQTHSKILVVSTSKGGLEVAIVLGKLLKPEETKAIKAWVSVGGLLRGSPVVDDYMHWPKSWVAKLILLVKGRDKNLLTDLSYEKRAQEFNELSFPEDIKLIHFIGAPFSTQIDKRIRGRYRSMIEYGPNDGLTPIADEVTTNGIVITELGLDHYFKHEDIDKMTVALAMIIAQIQE